MAVDQLNQTVIGSTNFTFLVEAVDKNSKGLNTISLSNYDTDAAPVVKEGSVFENNGSTFLVTTGDETPTGYAGIAVSTTFYLYYDESAGAFIFDSTVPTWNDALQGYYNGNDRAFFSMYKDSGGTLYKNKHLLTHLSEQQIGALQLEGKMKWKYYYNKPNTTSNTEVYDELVTWLPSVGDSMKVFAQGLISGSEINIISIYRDTATTIHMKTFLMDNTSTGLSTGAVNITNGVSTSLQIEIMSNFDPL